MQFFSYLYDKVMAWAAHRHAAWYLAAISFAESSFFPIPPDVMLAPMALAKVERAWFYAALTTVTSVAGGLFGYFIGYFAFDFVGPWIQSAGYWESYLQARAWFDAWGVWIVFVAGFSPIPYKAFTIAAGTVSMAVLPFTLASILGRGGRFFLVAALMRWGGKKMEGLLKTYIDRLGWLVVAGVLLIYIYTKYD